MRSKGLQTFFKTNIAVDDVVVCAPTSGRIASVEVVGGLDVVAFLLAVGEGRLDQLLVLRVVQIAVCRRDGTDLRPIHPVLVHVLDEVGGGCGFRRGAVRILQLHPVALVEEVHRIVGAVLQGVGFRDLVGAQGVGHIGPAPTCQAARTRPCRNRTPARRRRPSGRSHRRRTLP